VFNHVVIWGSVAFYFAMTLFINSSLIGNQYMGCLRMALSCPQFWFTLFLTLAVLIMPVVAIRFHECSIKPTLSDRVRLKQRMSRLRAAAKANLPSTFPGHRRKSSIRRSRRSVRSGYAFAHQEGFGTLIMSGKLTQKPSMRFGGGISGLLVTNTASGAPIGSGSGSFASTHAASMAGVAPADYHSSSNRNTVDPTRSLANVGSLSSRARLDSDSKWANQESPPSMDYQAPTLPVSSTVSTFDVSPTSNDHLGAHSRQVSHESSNPSESHRPTEDRLSNGSSTHLTDEVAHKSSSQALTIESSNDTKGQLRRRVDRQHSIPEKRVAPRNRKLQPQPSLQPAPVEHKSNPRVYPANTAPSSIDI
jgi:protein required for attachment to host cells